MPQRLDQDHQSIDRSIDQTNLIFLCRRSNTVSENCEQFCKALQRKIVAISATVLIYGMHIVFR